MILAFGRPDYSTAFWIASNVWTHVTIMFTENHPSLLTCVLEHLRYYCHRYLMCCVPEVIYGSKPAACMPTSLSLLCYMDLGIRHQVHMLEVMDPSLVACRTFENIQTIPLRSYIQDAFTSWLIIPLQISNDSNKITTLSFLLNRGLSSYDQRAYPRPLCHYPIVVWPNGARDMT